MADADDSGEPREANETREPEGDVMDVDGVEDEGQGENAANGSPEAKGSPGAKGSPAEQGSPEEKGSPQGKRSPDQDEGVDGNEEQEPMDTEPAAPEQPQIEEDEDEDAIEWGDEDEDEGRQADKAGEGGINGEADEEGEKGPQEEAPNDKDGEEEGEAADEAVEWDEDEDEQPEAEKETDAAANEAAVPGDGDGEDDEGVDWGGEEDMEKELEEVFGSDDDEPKEAPGAAAKVHKIELKTLPRPEPEEKLTYIRLPASISVDPREFFNDPDTFAEEHRGGGNDVIRWRNQRGADGKMKPVSNARLVTWSDGSMTMHIGADVLEVKESDLKGERQHVFVRQHTALQSQGVLRRKMIVNPISHESEIQRKLTSKMARSSKMVDRKTKAELGTRSGGVENKRSLEKAEQDRLRQSSKQDARRRRSQREYGSKLTAEFIEPDVDDGDGPAAKRKRPDGGPRPSRYDESEDSDDRDFIDDSDSGGSDANDAASKGSEGSASVSSSSSDSDAEIVVNKGAKNKKRKNVLSDSDEDD
mmetsp:Transcript_19674/g.42511  ORF Transcript_19674/g.42511 Transcript_19674/m.42511 type:complete len:531 (-) Transcript_19674:59-1651(-)